MNDSPKALSVVTIQPREQQTPGQAQQTFGTRVILSDGSELTGITSITMTALPNDLWRATITVLPQRVEPITVEALITEGTEPIPYEDPDVVEATTMEDLANGIRRYVPV